MSVTNFPVNGDSRVKSILELNEHLLEMHVTSSGCDRARATTREPITIDGSRLASTREWDLVSGIPQRNNKARRVRSLAAKESHFLELLPVRFF